MPLAGEARGRTISVSELADDGEFEHLAHRIDMAECRRLSGASQLQRLISLEVECPQRRFRLDLHNDFVEHGASSQPSA